MLSLPQVERCHFTKGFSALERRPSLARPQRDKERSEVSNKINPLILDRVNCNLNMFYASSIHLTFKLLSQNF